MTTLKVLLKRIVIYIFITQYKELLSVLVAFAKTKQLNFKIIQSLVKFYSFFNPNVKEKFRYVKSSEIPCFTSDTIVHAVQHTLYSSSPQFYYQNLDLLKIQQQLSYVVKLSDVKIIGSSNIILVDSEKTIYEPMIHDKKLKWAYTDTSVLKYIDRNFVVQFKDSKKIIPSGIMLSGNFSWNYYHLTYEFVTKFHLLDNLDLPNNIPIIIDDIVENVPQYQELLSYFNLQNRKLIFLKKGFAYDVKLLYYPSQLNIIPPNFKDINDIVFTDFLFNLNTIKFLRDTLLPKMIKTNTQKRIFLSRRNASSLRSYNEDDVIKVFKQYDFEVVCPENYTIAEQVYIFNNASFIAGVTGAAFTNIAFCNQGCKILCISSTQNELSIFSTIAKYLNLDFQYLSAHEKSYKPKCIHEKFEIHENKIEKVLVDFLRR